MKTELILRIHHVSALVLEESLMEQGMQGDWDEPLSGGGNIIIIIWW